MSTTIISRIKRFLLTLPLLGLALPLFSQTNINDALLYNIHIDGMGSGNSFIDTLEVISDANDSVKFEIKGATGFNRGTYLKTANKVYLAENKDSMVLLYDFDLDSGDVFYLNTYGGLDSFSVDSIKTLNTYDGKGRKHWFLHRITNPMYEPIVWIEDIGSKVLGWNWLNYGRVHLPYVQAICSSSDQELIYWRESDFGWSTKPEPSCDFKELDKYLSVEQLGEELVKLSLYPNPTQGAFSIESSVPIQGYRVFTALGNQVLFQKGTVNNHQIDLTERPSGIYFIEIRTANELLTKSVIKE